MLNGFDIHWARTPSGEADFDDAPTAGYSFCIIKATEGSSYSHEDWYRRNAPRMLASPLIPGAYHFGRSSSGGIDQALYFLNVVGDTAGMMLALDFETHGPTGTKMTWDQAQDFVRVVHERTERYPLFYSTDLDAHIAQQDSLLRNCPNWIARYGPRPLNPFVIWQKGAGPGFSGVPEGIDFNVFEGSMAELRKFAGREEAGAVGFLGDSQKGDQQASDLVKATGLGRGAAEAYGPDTSAHEAGVELVQQLKRIEEKLDQLLQRR